MTEHDGEQGRRKPIILREDTIAGLMFMVIGAFGLWIGQDYTVGTATRMGPGYIPRALCWLLFGLGFAVTIGAMLQRGSTDGDDPPAVKLRPLLLVPLAVIAFAVALEPLGLVLATAALIILAALADSEQRLLEVIGTVIVLVALTVAVFVWGVGIPLPVWPGF